MEEWIFTFGCGHKHCGKCVRIKGSYEEARKKMVSKFGMHWAFQYSADEWDGWKIDPNRNWQMEKEVDWSEIDG